MVRKPATRHSLSKTCEDLLLVLHDDSLPLHGPEVHGLVNDLVEQFACLVVRSSEMRDREEMRLN